MNNDSNLFGIDGINSFSVKIKNAEIALQTTESPNKTLSKKIKEVETLEQLGILPRGLTFTGNCVKSSVTDRLGAIHDSYCIGVRFPCNSYKHYIKTTGNGCGTTATQALNEKETFNSIEIISGICLYGGNKFKLNTHAGKSISLTGVDFHIGESIREITVDDSFSVYEVEAIVGLSTYINELIKWNEAIKIIHTEIPKGQYYLYLANAYEEGWLSPEIYQKSIYEIDKRHDAIFQAYKNRLNIEVNKIDPLSEVEKYICERLENKEMIFIEAARNILSMDDIWKKILIEHKQTSWKDLSYLSSVYVFLKFGRKKQNHITLQIDDPIEEKIQIKASKIIKKFGDGSNYRVWGVYPIQKIVLNPDYYADSDLYYNVNIKLTTSLIKEIISKHREGRVINRK